MRSAFQPHLSLLPPRLLPSPVFAAGALAPHPGPRTRSCVAYHPNGDLVLVGLGGPVGGQPAHKSKTVKTKKDGAFVVLNEPDLTATYEARDSKAPLTACKFSPDGEAKNTHQK